MNARIRYVVSACLAGARTRYDGSSKELDSVKRLVERGVAIPVCPEQLGGLPTPRAPSEIRGAGGGAALEGTAKVVSADGRDLTEQFVRGAEESARLAKLFGATAAILKSKSPSCGCGMIYDGGFTGRLVQGDGVTAALFKKIGLKVMTEEDVT